MVLRDITGLDLASTVSVNATMYAEENGEFKRVTVDQVKAVLGIEEATQQEIDSLVDILDS